MAAEAGRALAAVEARRNAASFFDGELNDREFSRFQKMIYEAAGINMSSAKKALVAGRLGKRIRQLGLSGYGEYLRLLDDGDADEKQMAVDLLTTNETSFFREPRHFDFLRDKILGGGPQPGVRLWSAASSTGEEAYTMAMMLAEHAGTEAWEVVGTDISTRVLDRARNGHYAMEGAANIPDRYLKKYCLKGIGRQSGTFIVAPELRRRVTFVHANLNRDMNKLGTFDVVFLRNVLIYFDQETKARVVSNVLRQLKSGGHLMVGHSESLNGVNDDIKPVAPSIYRKP